jgi:hypothetical protein
VASMRRTRPPPVEGCVLDCAVEAASRIDEGENAFGVGGARAVEDLHPGPQDASSWQQSEQLLEISGPLGLLYESHLYASGP